MSYLVLARKYRPRSFDTLIGQDHVVRALTHALSTQRLHHAWLFTGTRGVGKTTLSRILAKSLNCETGITATPCGHCQACLEIDAGRFVDYVELDAASNRGVDEMTQLLEQAVYAPGAGRFKVYMIDEVHMLTGHAFNAMLKTLEEPPPHVKFILATTDPQKIPVTVLSRCLQFNLKQMTGEAIVQHLQQVLTQESIPFQVPALRLIGQAASGSMRDALSLTDQAIAYSAGDLTAEAVQGMLGTIDQRHLVDLLAALARNDAGQVIAVADDLAARGLSYAGALADLSVLLSRVAIAQRLGQAVPEDDPMADDIVALSAQLHPDQIQLFYSVAVHSRQELSLAPDEYAGFVMACLRMLALGPAPEPVPPARAPQPSSDSAPAGAGASQAASASAAPAAVAQAAAQPAVAQAAVQQGGAASGMSAAAPAAMLSSATPAAAPAGSDAAGQGIATVAVAPQASGADASSRMADAASGQAAHVPQQAAAMAPASSSSSAAGGPNAASASRADANAANTASPSPAATQRDGDQRPPAWEDDAGEPVGASAASASAAPVVAAANANANAGDNAGANVVAPTAVAHAGDHANPTINHSANPAIDANAAAPAPAATAATAVTAVTAATAAPSAAPDAAAVMAPPPAPAAPSATAVSRQSAAPVDDIPDMDDIPDDSESAGDAFAMQDIPPDIDGGFDGAGMGDVMLPEGLPIPAGLPQDDAAPSGARRRRKGDSLRDMTRERWPALAATLPVTGLAAELARQSEWIGGSDTQLCLRVAVHSLAQTQGRARLRTVLSEHFGVAVDLQVEFGATGDDTAHAVAQAERAARQRQAEISAQEDPFVQTLVHDFGARIVPDSVRAVLAAPPSRKAA